jgi:cell division protein FtsW
MRYWYKTDWVIIVPILALLSIGLVMIFSTSPVVGLANYSDPFYFIKRLFAFLLVGVGSFFIGLIVPHELYRKLALQSFVVSVVLLLLTLSPLGVTIGGAQRWLNLGVIQFQPTEIAKFSSIILFALFLDRPAKILSNFKKGILPMLLLMGLLAGLLILQPDLGNIGLLTLVMMSLLFLSHVPLRHLGVLCGVTLVGLIVSVLTHPYQMRRVTGFLDPWEDPLGKSYHMVQSLIAIGSGGFLGAGLGESKLKYFYLPLHYSDFIFSIICEEGGFILAAVVIGLFYMFVFRVYTTLRKSQSLFSFYLGMGAAFLISFQAFINIAVVIGLFPVTGIVLTFISFGGTSLIVSLFLVGVIMNIANRVIQQSNAVQEQQES